MKVILRESQVDMVFNHFKQIANKVGYFEALRSLKFPFTAANIFLKPKNGEYFTAKELTEIMYYYVFYAKQIPSRIEYKNFIIENRETESQGFYWDTDILKNSKLRSTTESCFGYAQPFWESEEVASYFGRLRKMLLVGRFDFYTRGDWANPDEDYIEEDQFHKSYNFDMSGLKFKTLDEAKNWYLNEYPKIVIEFAEDFFESARLHNKNN